MTEADLQEKFAAVSLQARQQCEALFKTAHGDLGAAWMASRTAVSSLAMLQVCKNVTWAAMNQLAVLTLRRMPT